ncbi:MAG: hypothetical protein PHD82_02905 [Candidatus Riflebacteria bacterium]|nr:hypothetical protein [Candidatus Riflebacteria bacterium]
MPSEHVVDYNENTFYHSFTQQSFATRIARWIKAFSYSFIVLLVFAMILEELQKFCITPPRLFLQFLFLLIMSGIIELISIQMSNVNDHCILDYAKNLVTVIQHRFFIKKVSVLASFEQVRVIGVSAAPHSFLSGLFSKSQKNYALVIMNYRNHLIHITEHELSLEEANNLALDLSNRHMPSARLVQGEENMELVADALTGDVNTRPVKNSLAGMVDTTVLPTLQAFCGLMITAGIVSLAMFAISRISTGVFDTNLLVAYQPVNQLFLRPVPRLIETPPVQNGEPAPTNPDTATASAATVVASPATDLTISDQPQITAASTTPDLTVGLTASSTEASIVSKIENPEELSASETILYKASESSLIDAPVVSTPESPSEPDQQLTQLPPQETLTGNDKPENHGYSISDDNSKTDNSPNSWPTIHPTNANPPVQTDYNRMQPAMPVRTIPQASFLQVAGQVQLGAPIKPVIEQQNSMPVEPPHQTESNQITGQTVAFEPVVRDPAPKISNKENIAELSVLAGHGLHPLVELGDNAEAALKKLGKPIAEQISGRSKQFVFSGFSFSSDATTGMVNQITITRKNFKKGVCSTPGKISIGSSFALIKTQMGPSTILDGQPGLHFPHLGISFIPSPQTPDSVGAIKIYPTGSRPD